MNIEAIFGIVAIVVVAILGVVSIVAIVHDRKFYSSANKKGIKMNVGNDASDSLKDE